MIRAMGYAATTSSSGLAPMDCERDEAGALDVEIEVPFCGVCNSEIDQMETSGSTKSLPTCPATRSSAA